ncbi:MAG: hypothetical protein ACLSHL_09340 [Alistipes communis]
MDFSNIDVEVAGVVADFTAKVRGMHIGEGTTLVADAVVKGLPDIRDTWFDLCALACTLRPRRWTGWPSALPDASRRINWSGYWAIRAASTPMPASGGNSRVVRHAAGRCDRGGRDVACNLRMSPLKKGLSSVRATSRRATRGWASCLTLPRPAGQRHAHGLCRRRDRQGRG